jgi:hypothetical protein
LPSLKTRRLQRRHISPSSAPAGGQTGRLPADTVIVSGGEKAASKRGLATKIFRPDLAGAESQGQITRRYHARNQQIVDAADEVFALVAPDRKGGTEDTIRRAQRKGIPITVL